ncbi:MAG: CoA transferase [Acetobacteraceae bacterium]|nr:CoA transferase [Acetobacteraceae bacterium]MBV8573560.1 CoA transferase [Acetobacteraceae bacterium]
MSINTTGNGQRLPLSGYRILDFTIMTAGPVATMLLGDLGADVIKVEELEKGDHSRNIGTVFVGRESAQFMSENRNKRSIRVDLKRKEGRDLLLRLVQDCDIVTENFRPGTLERLGFGYEDVRRVKPDIIYASCSAFGQTGPYAHLPANDPVIQAISGLMAMTGEAGGPPMRIGNPYPDFGGAALLAFAVTTALLHRERTGEGQYVDLSLLEGAVFATIPRDGETLRTGTPPARLGSASGVFTPYQSFTGSDGQPFFVACFTEKFWQSLCDAIERPEWKSDPRFANNPARCANRPVLISLLAGIFASQPATYWLDQLGQRNVPAGKIQNLHQALREDPQLVHLGMVVAQEHPRAGRVETLATPIRFHATPSAYRLPPPVLGEHTAEILGDFGLSGEEIASLAESRIVAEAEPASGSVTGTAAE